MSATSMDDITGNHDGDPITDTDAGQPDQNPLWYKDAVIYQVHV